MGGWGAQYRGEHADVRGDMGWCLQGMRRLWRAVGGCPAEAVHGDARSPVWCEGGRGDGCLLHACGAEAGGAPSCSWHHVPVWWPVRAGGHAQLERNEPVPKPMACVVLLCAGAAEHHAEDLGGQGREQGGSAGEADPACHGQLQGAARQVRSCHRRRGRKRSRGHVRQELRLLRRGRACCMAAVKACSTNRRALSMEALARLGDADYAVVHWQRLIAQLQFEYRSIFPFRGTLCTYAWFRHNLDVVSWD